MTALAQVVETFLSHLPKTILLRTSLPWTATPGKHYSVQCTCYIVFVDFVNCIIFLFFSQDRVYVQQNGVDNVYNLGLILFRDLVSCLFNVFDKGCVPVVVGHCCCLHSK